MATRRKGTRTPSNASASSDTADATNASLRGADVSTNTVREKVVPGAGPTVTPDISATPDLFWFDHIGNLFDKGRPGRAVVRPDDLLAMRIETRNLKVTPGTPPRLTKTGSSSAYLILHFPPQAITEETFFEQQPVGTSDPDSGGGSSPGGRYTALNLAIRILTRKALPAPSETLRPPPVRARIAGESRLAFKVPNDFDVPYTLEGILEACQTLSLSVTSNARSFSRPLLELDSSAIFNSQVLARMKPTKRAQLSSFAAQSLRIGGAMRDDATLRSRQYSEGQTLRAVPDNSAVKIPDFSAWRYPPKPGNPSSIRTSIEMPWRLIVSPHGAERWRHARQPVHSPVSNRTELWHTRLTAPGSDGGTIEPPHPDPRRTIRAIWALDGEGSTHSMQRDFPASSALPAPSLQPFRMPMDDFDRFQISHLSSNFSLNGYYPEAVDTNLMMLTALGGWLDSRGAWEPPGLSVEEWVHRASMGRDHYVRIVYRGFLYPFGHRVSLVKVSERKFHNGAKDDDGLPTIENVTGNTAYLRQRLFIVIRERERRFDLNNYAQLQNLAGDRRYINQLPFSKVRILTQVTPNLDKPTESPSSIAPYNDQRMFWPHVAGQPFAFQCVATDLDGRPVAFELPMIFMDNTLACPRLAPHPSTGIAPPDWVSAEDHAVAAQNAYRNGGNKREIGFKRQRVALATSTKAGDTSVEVEQVLFDGEAEKNNGMMRNASDDLSRPLFFPRVESWTARVGAMSHLSGTDANNKLVWNQHYLKQGFNNNVGQVFVDVEPTSGMAQLDFSAQGDRSGGFVQPNLKPQALSRLAGPVMGDVGAFIDGDMPAGAGFPMGDNIPSSLSDLPLPLLFGCIPLGELIDKVIGLDDNPERVPKFASEASTQLESFINNLVRSYTLLAQIASQPGGIGKAAIAVFKATLADQLAQANAYAAAQIAPIQVAINQLDSALDDVAGELDNLIDKLVDDAAIQPSLAALPATTTTARNMVTALVTAANTQVNGVSLPSGLRQSILGTAQQMDRVLNDLAQLPTLVAQGGALFQAVGDIVGDPGQLGDLFSDAQELANRLTIVANAITPFTDTLGSLELFAGAPRQVVIDALTAVEDLLGNVATLVELLAGDELTIRFDWNPEISSWWLPGVSTSEDPIFRANDKRGFLVAVEASVKKNGASAPKIGVVCSLKHFDLILIAPASFMELNFEKIEFRVDTGAKLDVDVLLSDIKFVGPLSFVETLRDLIPLDGFSDPPYLDITTKGIDAGFDIALPSIAVGVLNISNLSLGAGFTVPFIGQPLSVRFNFCTREQPFLLTVYMFGGGGFFGVTVDPHGVQILEASFEFGASLSVDFGVASGGVHVMAGLYFRMEMDDASLTGYFRLGGHVDVLGLITASLELYLELRYEFESGKCVGKAQLTIEISVFIFSGSVTITCERKLSGANGDPTLREMLGLDPALPLKQELDQITDNTHYPWREYCEAFA